MRIFKILYPSLFVLINFSYLISKPLIILYLQPMPKAVLKDDREISKTLDEQTNKISHISPRKFSKNSFKNALRTTNIPSLSGFLVTYGGYMQYSRPDGLVAFPLKHVPETKINILVSSNVLLIPIRAQTPAFEELGSSDSALSRMYSYTKSKDKKGFTYWHVEETSLPSNNVISPITIIFHTDPQNFFIQEGDFYSEESAHVILPENIYVIGRYMNIKILLQFIDKACYYEPIKFKESAPKETLIETLIENH